MRLHLRGSTRAGPRVWRTSPGRVASTGCARLHGKLPLLRDLDVTGSGEADWGASLLARQRYGPVSLLAEIGFLSLGDPPGLVYNTLSSASLFFSYSHIGDRIYPLGGFTAATAARGGDPAYGDWSLGAGAIISSRVSLSALYSRGTTGFGPDHGFSISASLRS